MITPPVMELCAAQHGVVSRRQLTHDLGWSRDRVHRARRAGLLVPLTGSVFRIASSPETFLARAMSLQLHTGEVGFVSGWTAARLHGLRRMPVSPIHFTIPVEVVFGLPRWVELHRSSWYDARRDRQRLDDGMIVATPARTLFGLAADFNDRRFRQAAEDAWHLGLVTPREMLDYLERHRCRGKNGVSTIERWLEHALGDERPAQSYLERELLDALARIGLPRPTRQHAVVLPNGDTIHLDIAWPDVRLAIEPGANWWHGGDDRTRRDQHRDLACGEIGWQVLRLDESFAGDPTTVARRVRAVHRRRQRDLDATTTIL